MQLRLNLNRFTKPFQFFDSQVRIPTRRTGVKPQEHPKDGAEKSSWNG